MSFNFMDLTSDIRQKMIKEIQEDIAKNNLYYSKRFNQNGKQKYPEILIKNVTSNGNDVSLGLELKENQCFLTEEMSARGLRKVPVNAPEIFAEGEFNRFYIRALCLHALAEGKNLEVYRAKNVVGARSSSQEKIGDLVDPQSLLNDVRNNIGIDTHLGLPAGPNSGLSVKLVD